MSELLSLEIPEIKEAILLTTKDPVSRVEFERELTELGIDINHQVDVNLHYLFTGGELKINEDLFLIAKPKSNPLQIPFPNFLENHPAA